MSELKYPQDSHEWARRRGIAQKCQHGWYNPSIGCPKCKEEEKEREKRKEKEEEKKRKLRGIFDNVIWPDE